MFRIFFVAIIKLVQEHASDLDDMQVIVAGASAQNLEVYPDLIEVPQDVFLTKLKPKSEYEAKDSLPYGNLVVSELAQEMDIETLLGGGRTRTVVLGNAGIGKTVLLRRFTKKAAKGKIETLADIELVLYIELKNLSRNNPIHLREFIIGEAGRKLTPHRKKLLFQWMVDHEEKCLFVMDGLDQFIFDMNSADATASDCFEKCTPTQFLRDIFNGKFFTKSKVLLSSREHAIKKLPQECLPKNIIFIIGLSPVNVDKLIVKMAGRKCLDYLMKKNVSLYNLASNPLYLSFIAASFNRVGEKCPKTLTGVILLVLSTFMECEHVRSDFDIYLKKLCAMAFQGTLERRVTFDKGNFESHGLDIDGVHDVMVSLPSQNENAVLKSQLLQGDWNYFFLHQSLQEILSALHVTQNFDALSPHLKNDHFEIVSSLLHGICCNDENKPYLKKMQGKCTFLRL